MTGKLALRSCSYEHVVLVAGRSVTGPESIVAVSLFFLRRDFTCLVQGASD